MEILSKAYNLIFSLAGKLLGILEVFLFLRLLLKFLGANPASPAVAFLYKYTGLAVSPFGRIFPDFNWPAGYLIETSTISAMIGYAILFFIFLEVLKFIFRE